MSLLAERAQMTKQAMAEHVQHLETHGDVIRVPDPHDRRAKLVLPTDRRGDSHCPRAVPELEARVTKLMGANRAHALRQDLETIRRGFTASTR